ncbi:MAG: hypothetical protein J3K34DRAFT_410172 [Monoraphidium minutum]|nr:MAG: hypothetical protein J3K34DRAFT_410172 [Monoraphidium minutum]
MATALPAVAALEQLKNGTLKRVYRELVVLIHPDKYQGDKALAGEAFRVLNGAYETLSPLVG